MSNYDLVIQNALVVRPGAQAPERLDVAVSDGRFAAFEKSLDASGSAEVVDDGGRHAVSRRGRRAHARRHLLAAGGGR